MAGTWNKREREQKKKNLKKQKEEKKLERKQNSSKGKGLDDMLAYVDEYGNITNTPPDPTKKSDLEIPPVVANSRELQQSSQDNIHTGIITFFDENKGYGFIKDAQSGESFFVHINDSAIQLKRDLSVKFEIQKGPKGYIAKDVQSK